MIREVVEHLKSDLGQADKSPVSAAAQRLESAISVRNAEFDQIIELAHEVIDLCGSPAPAVVQSLDAITLTEVTTRPTG